MNIVEIRKATAGDLETLLRFEQGVIAAERPFDETLKKEEIRYYDLQHLLHSEDALLVVAVVNGVVAGCGYARKEAAKAFLRHRSFAYLGFMYTEPQHRGRGINRKVIDALKEWARSKELTELRLEVYHENEPARKAYEKAGFKPHMMEMRMGL